MNVDNRDSFYVLPFCSSLYADAHLLRLITIVTSIKLS